MGDKTLVEGEIARLVAEANLIENFSPTQLRRCFYDFRAGSKLIHAHPDGHIFVDLGTVEAFALRPGETCTVYSLEKIFLPLNVKGHLSLRGRLANQKIFFSGGPIDPGYKGYLFFTLINLGSAAVNIAHREGIVTCEFIQLEQSVLSPYSDRVFDDIPSFRLPSLPERKLHDWIEITAKLDRLDEKVEGIARESKVSHALVVNVFYALVAGIVAGLVIAVLQSKIFLDVLSGMFKKPAGF